MRTNIITIKIVIPNDSILKKIENTPALRRLSRIKLKVGNNYERVNHYQYSQILRMYDIAGAIIIKI